jgi:hypothetical protein
MENGLLSNGRDQAAHGRPEQAHTALKEGFPIRRGRAPEGCQLQTRGHK